MDRQEILAIAALLRQGRAGEANSRYARLLAQLPAVETWEPSARRDCLRILSVLSRQQKQEDWVGMADSLEYGMAVMYL